MISESKEIAQTKIPEKGEPLSKYAGNGWPSFRLGFENCSRMKQRAPAGKKRSQKMF